MTNEEPCVRPVRAWQRWHMEVLVIACLVLVASFSLEVTADDHVGLIWMPDLVLPPLCMAREFGVSCPGCGLTRSFVHLARGEWHASWAAHRLGWLLAALVMAQLPYRLYVIRRGDHDILSPQVRKWIGHGLISLLVVNWLLGMLVPRCSG